MMDPHLPEFVEKIFTKFIQSKYEIYLVGGSVRDILTGKPVGDWDFTTNATPDEILKIFPDGFYGNEFGTVGIKDESSENPYQITTFRKEFGYSDARRPDKVEWGKTLKEDLARRDFTINAMAFSPISQKGDLDRYELIDIYGGQRDLKNKIIRAVGDADERFSEDALRMMRAVRIASQLGFKVEDKTLEAISVNAKLINRIAKERVKQELFKILSSPHPKKGIEILKDSGLMNEILPEMEKAFGVEQKSPGRHHIYDVGTHSLLALKNCKSPDPVVRLATLIHDIGKPQTYKKLPSGVITFYNHEVISARIAMNIANRLKFSNEEKDLLVRLVRWHQFTVDERQTDSAIRRFIKNVGKENIDKMLEVRVGDRLGGGASETSWRLEEFKKRIKEVQKQPFCVTDLAIDGKDVMKKLNLKPGPKVGEILNQLFEAVVAKEVKNTKKDLLAKIESLK